MVKRYYCDDELTITEQPNGEYVLFEDYATLEAENADLKRRLDIAKGELCRIHNQDLGDLSMGIDKVFTAFRLRKHHEIMRALQGKPPDHE